MDRVTNLPMQRRRCGVVSGATVATLRAIYTELDVPIAEGAEELMHSVTPHEGGGTGSPGL